MGTPSEPLLPVDQDPPSRPGVWIAAGAAAVLLATGAAFFFLRRGEAPRTDAPGTGLSDPAVPREAAAAPGRPANAPPRADDAEERQARQRYEAALSFEQAEPAQVEERMARWRDVMTTHPTSSWARKADERYRTASASLEAILGSQFEGTRRDAQTLASAGHFVDALELLETYRAAQTRDLLKRRAETEIAGLENACRLAYNEATSKARELSARGDFAGAVPLFESLAPGAIPEVAERCRTSIAQLRTAAAERERYQESKKGDDARRAFREEVAPKILSLVRARRYDDALREMSQAAAAPANAAIREEIAAERASLVDASAFWEAFLRALRGRVGQEASLLLSDGKRVSGKITRVLDDRIVLESGEASADAPLDGLHADLLVGWTLGKTLAAEEGLTYVKAALFFFCEGRDDLARLYLATARELNGPAEAAEKTFRGGFLRAALSARK